MGPTQLRTPADLAVAVRRLRGERDMTQATLAERAGVSRRLVIEVERGKPRLELLGVLKVLAALDVGLSLQPTGPDTSPDDDLGVEDVPW